MIPLPWTPRWYVEGISLWALAARIAFVSTATILTVLEYLVGASRAHRALLWFGSRGTIARVGEQLYLPPQWSSATFCSQGPLQLHEREHYRLALRWCPQCLASWYHSPLFQDARVAECPAHKVPLLERCLYCSRFVDPLAIRPWSCAECRKPLADLPGDWSVGFTTDCVPVVAAERQHVPWRRADDGASLWVGADGTQVFSDDQYETNMWLFEQLSALWDHIAGGHRQCAHGEAIASMGQYSGARAFTCPVASAFLQAGLAMGIEPEPLAKWPSFRGSTPLWAADRSVPAGAQPLVAREQLRLFILDALEHLGSVARKGWSEAFWNFEDSRRTKVITTSKGLFIADGTSDDELLRACRAAAESCRRPQLSAA